MKLESLIDLAEQPTTCAEGQIFREGLRQALHGWHSSIEERRHNLKHLLPLVEGWTKQEEVRLTINALENDLCEFRGKGR